MSRTVHQQGQYDDTGERVLLIRTIPEIEIRSSTSRGKVDGLPILTLEDGTPLTPAGHGKYKRVDNGRVISIIE